MKLGNNLKEPKVGEKYCVVRNRFYSNKLEVFEGIVSSVERKYFTLKREDNNYWKEKFTKDDLIHINGEYSPEYFLYNNREDYEKKIKAKECRFDMEHNSMLKYLSNDEVIALYDILKDRKEKFQENKDYDFEEIKF